MPDAQAVAPEEERSKVLCIDDAPANVELIRQILRRMGVDCVAATDGRSGLALSGSERPDLILLDLSLPDRPGEEVLQALREDPTTQHIPVLVLSADPARIPNSAGASADAHLGKPFALPEFMQVVTELLPPGTRALTPPHPVRRGL